MSTTASNTTLTESTLPPEIAGMGVEAQALFERVRLRLGLGDGPVEIGRYQLRGRLGEGGMGVVYLAWDPQLGREVAVKLVRARPLANTTKLRARLLREARILAKLRHPNVVTIYDAGEHGGEVFLAMEYVPGHSLREWQENEQRPLVEVLRLYLEAGRGLAAAHAVGIVHRDFKPDNVLISADHHALVGDFGLANTAGDDQASADDDVPEGGPLDADARMTRTGELLGTVAYMAPEQLRGESVDARSDQYSFCLALWEAATEQRPFDGRNPDELATAKADAAPNGGEKLPNWLRRTLEVGLAADPRARHPDMETLVTKLERGLGRRKRWLLGGGLALAGLLGLGGAAALGVHYMPSECTLATQIGALRATAASPRLQVEAHTRVRFDNDLHRLEHQARLSCEAGDRSTQQYIGRWLGPIELVLASASDHADEDLRRLARWLEHARYDRPPPEPMSERVFEALVQAKSAEYADQLVQAIAAADEALGEAKSEVDFAEAHLQRGRAHSLAGHYEQALADYRAAHLAALRCGFVDAQLRAQLLAARTLVMRLEQIDEGRNRVAEAQAHLVFLREPWLSPRHADLLELEAAIDKRTGAPDQAAHLQRQVITLHYLARHGDEELARALTNLGTIEEGYRYHAVLAELAYRLALAVKPGFPDALLDLAHLLNERPRPLEKHELAFLDHALQQLQETGGHDLGVQAHTESLKLALRIEDTAALLEHEQALIELLATGEACTPANIAGAWQLITLARASRGQLGPGYRQALERWREADPDVDTLDRIDLELNAVDLATAPNPSSAQALLGQLSVELRGLPPSERRQELIQATRIRRADTQTRQ
jgi:serine/threonine protein kinase